MCISSAARSSPSDRSPLSKKARPHSRLTPVQAGVEALLGHEQFIELAEVGKLRRFWPQIVGPMLAGHCEPIACKDGILRVAVDHPAIGQHLRILSDEIRDACRQRLRLRINAIFSKVESGAGIHDLPPPPRRRTPSFRERKAAAAALRALKDKPLRRALFRARLAQLTNSDAPLESDSEPPDKD